MKRKYRHTETRDVNWTATELLLNLKDGSDQVSEVSRDYDGL